MFQMRRLFRSDSFYTTSSSQFLVTFSETALNCQVLVLICPLYMSRYFKCPCSLYCFTPPSNTCIFRVGTWRPTLLTARWSSSTWMEKWRNVLCSRDTVWNTLNAVCLFLQLSEQRTLEFQRFLYFNVCVHVCAPAYMCVHPVCCAHGVWKGGIKSPGSRVTGRKKTIKCQAN